MLKKRLSILQLQWQRLEILKTDSLLLLMCLVVSLIKCVRQIYQDVCRTITYPHETNHNINLHVVLLLSLHVQM